MDLGLRDSIVIVSGGASGIGAAVVGVLLAEGARPVILDRQPPGDGLAGAEAHALDLRDEDACGAAVADVLARHGRIDGLVNNAGANDGAGLMGGSAAFRASLEANLLHCFTLTHLTRAALCACGGAIVNVSSKVAVTGQGGTSGYVAAKAALLGLTREWAAELAPHGVRVNAVLPAEVMTPHYRRWLESFPDPDARARAIAARIPLGGRMTRAEEIARTVVFLLSDAASHTTGQWLFPDGGYVHLDRALGTGAEGAEGAE